MCHRGPYGATCKLLLELDLWSCIAGGLLAEASRYRAVTRQVTGSVSVVAAAVTAALCGAAGVSGAQALQGSRIEIDYRITRRPLDESGQRTPPV